MSWERGRSDIERLLNDGELERVTPSPERSPTGCSPPPMRTSRSRARASKTIPPEPFSSATTPPGRRPLRFSPSRGSARRPVGATSR